MPINKKIVIMLIIPLVFCALVATFIPYQSKINCYNNGSIKECLIEKNTFINRNFSPEWDEKIVQIDLTHKTIKDEKTSSFPYQNASTIKSSRVAISRNQIILHALDNTFYRMTYDDPYLTAAPYKKLEEDIKKFNENRVLVFTYEFTNVMGFVYCLLLLLIYYGGIFFLYHKKGQIVRNFHENGLLKSTGRMHKGKREGEWKFYDVDGETLIGTTFYKDGQKNGSSIDYYPNGQKKIEFYVKKGVPNGKSKSYFENGNIQVESKFENGVMEGEYKEYYQNGSIRVKGFLVHGKFQGPYFLYGENKRYIHHYNCMDDIRKSCQTTFFDENGDKLPDGSYEEHYSNGNLRRKGKIKNGFPDGKWYFYYEDSGNVYQETEFKNGYAKSCLDYYPGGKVKQRRSLQKGVYEGMSEGYYITGELKERGNYKDDFKEGVWEYYDKKGKLIKKEHYHRGKMTTDEERLLEQHDGDKTVIQRIVVHEQVINALKYETDFSMGVCKLYNEKGNVQKAFLWGQDGITKLITYDDNAQPTSTQVWKGDGKTLVQPDVKSDTAYVSNCVENTIVTVGRFEFTLNEVGHVIGVRCQIQKS